MDKNWPTLTDYCEKLFESSYRRQNEGRFVVKLPVKGEILLLLDNSKEALKRFLVLEQKFIRRPDLKSEYVAFMREYQQLGHMKQVETNKNDKFQVFLPHHAVIKESSSTVKTRMVFDASSRYAKGKSLNGALYKDPTLQSDLFTLMVQFRRYKYVLCADISKMYIQILIDEEQTLLQSIVWRDEPKDEIQEFKLLSVTYGTKPASFLAVKCLHKLAEIERINYPRVAEIVCSNFYMDYIY